jgi:hypothetical protein
MAGPPLHPLCAPVAFLLGNWHGEGHGGYPGITPFAYREERRVWHTGKPYVALEQRTWQTDGALVGRELHGEMGYLRCGDGGRLELVVAMGPGHVEMSTGSVEGSRITLASVEVVDTPSADAVSAVKRTWWLDGDVLRYELEMSAVDQPMTWHLAAELRRV